MLRIYSILLSILSFILPILGRFNKKIKKFVEGRENIFQEIENKRKPNDKIIWIHAASLGEYEQALPIINNLKLLHSEYKIWLTFFSPSGYEVKKNSQEVDYISYLPLDTSKNALQFIKILNPQLCIFVKYEIWPNYMKAIQSNGIPSILMSALFREDQSLFKHPKSIRTKALKKFNAIGVQDEFSLNLLHSIGYYNTKVTGDTRYDRAWEITQRNNQLDFLDTFCSNAKLCIVCGSTWPEDEALFIEILNQIPEGIKLVIAPHEIQPERIKKFCEKTQKKASIWSNHSSAELLDSSLLIIDTIGYLTRAYSYADIAYVGGAIGATGLHNILEPAAFGIPVVYGSNSHKHPEAELLAQDKGGFFVKDSVILNKILTQLIIDENLRKGAGKNAHQFIHKNTGATSKTLELIEEYL